MAKGACKNFLKQKKAISHFVARTKAQPIADEPANTATAAEIAAVMGLVGGSVPGGVDVGRKGDAEKSEIASFAAYRLHENHRQQDSFDEAPASRKVDLFTAA
jgi:hypothetical protein